MDRAEKYIIDCKTSKQILVVSNVFTRESLYEIEQKRIQRDSKYLNLTINGIMNVPSSLTNVNFLNCFKE